jgi:hypothetical protein
LFFLSTKAPLRNFPGSQDFFRFLLSTIAANPLEIPEKFHNSLTEQAFKDCGICSRDLRENDLAYLIEKAYRRFPENGGEELLFEIAVCHDCARSMRTQLSQDSRKAVNEFFYREFMTRLQELRDADDDYLMAHCLLSGKPMDQMKEYQIYAHCKGNHMADHGAAYILSDEVIESIQELLSDETRDQLRKFSDDHLGTPPELQKILDRSPILTI